MSGIGKAGKAGTPAASAGAALGLALAAFGTRALASLPLTSIPMLDRLQVDVWTLAFVTLAAIVTGLVFGVAPAIQLPASFGGVTGASGAARGMSVHDALKESARGSTQGARRTWIYAVIAYSVGQRTQEIGIRIALGASAGALQASIILQTLKLAALGLSIGVAASWVLGRMRSGLLFGVSATDPVTFLSMLAVLTLVAALAGYIPARRASRIDPLTALRAQ